MYDKKREEGGCHVRYRLWTEHRLRHALGACGLGLLLSVATTWAAAPVQEVDGETIYREHCATCHATATHAPKFMKPYRDYLHSSLGMIRNINSSNIGTVKAVSP